MQNNFKVNKDKGYISLWRSLMEHYLYPNHRAFTQFEAFIDILFSANHKDNKTLIDYKLVEIKRGQFITSELKLSLRWLWSRNQVRSFLKLLQGDNMIVKNSNSKFTMITVCNYDTYQANLPANKQQTNNKQTTGKQQTDTNNNDNNDNNGNNIVERKKLFLKSLEPYQQKYGSSMLNDFYFYWAEDNGKKMKFELRETWSIDGRLRTWYKKSKEGKQ